MNENTQNIVVSKEINSEKEYLAAVDEIIEYDRQYYDKCTPIISDYEYDLLVKRLEKFESKYPNLIYSNSPTLRVSESVSKGFVQNDHIQPMLSLANTYSKEEVQDFINRIYKLLEKKDVYFCVELKMDGTAVSIRYEKGKLVKGLTRGNGKSGDDITNNIKTIRSLPLQLKGDYPDVIEVRAEVFINLNTFIELNDKRQKDGLEPFANPRNAAAGSLKLLDPKEVSKRKLDIVCYGIAEMQSEVSSQYDLHKYLEKLGFPVSKDSYFTKAKTTDEIIDFSEKIKNKRKDLSFEIDGIVIKVDDLLAHKKIGTTGKSPRYAIAYKFAPEQSITKIKEITVQVGRTGVLTPVAELETVLLAGSNISRATLHNRDEIKRKDIREGDFVIIEKGGDVIPKVVKVDLTKRPNDSVIWKMPDYCPSCNTKVIQIEGEVAVRCPNKKCSERILKHLIYFAGKQAMDIDNLGIKLIEQLFDSGIVIRPSDIYKLSEKDFMNISGFKEKSIHNVLEGIEKSKNCIFSKFIMSLEIKYVGKETANILSQNAETIDNLIQMQVDELESIEGVGEKVADSIYDYFRDETNVEEVNALINNGINLKKDSKKIIEGHLFFGKLFVLTGKLNDYTRQEAISIIKERGGKSTSSVTKKTDYLLAGDDVGSKYKKAKSLNIEILSESQFIKLI